MTYKKTTIGVLSKQTGVKVTTIRYYETIALLQEPERTSSGQRVYENSAVERLNFIRHARELGFPIDAIRELIELQSLQDENCAVADKIASKHLSNVRRRIRQLSELEDELARITDACQGGKTGNCRVLSTLANHDHCTTKTHEKLDILIGTTTA